MKCKNDDADRERMMRRNLSQSLIQLREGKISKEDYDLRRRDVTSRLGEMKRPVIDRTGTKDVQGK